MHVSHSIRAMKFCVLSWLFSFCLVSLICVGLKIQTGHIRHRSLYSSNRGIALNVFSGHGCNGYSPGVLGKGRQTGMQAFCMELKDGQWKWDGICPVYLSST